MTQDIPESWLLPYCYDDGDLAEQIYLQQRDILVESGLMHIALVRMLTCPVLADIEFAGCQLDGDRVVKLHDEYVEEYNRIGAELATKFGNINFGSSQQLSKLLFEDLKFSIPRDHRGKPLVTPKGAPKTDAESLSKLEASNKRQEEFLELYAKYNQLDALLSKNLDFFKGVVEHDDAVFYGVFNQGQTGTHRLSSSGRKRKFPGSKKEKGSQLQNMPRSFKKLFTTHDDDYLVGEADGAQLEFRVAAEMGHDDVAREEIENDVDIHSVTSEVLINAGHPEFNGLTIKQGRQAAKSRTFAPLYGGMGRGEAEQQYAAFFKKKYNGISNTQRDWCLEVLENGKLRTPYGMIFYWPGTKMSRSGYIENSTSIHNYPVQGFATAEIIPIALVHFWHRTKGMPITVWNTIHDSIVSRVHKDFVEEYKELSKTCLTTDVYNFLGSVYNLTFRVPLGVGVKIDKHWGGGKEEHVWSVWNDGRERYTVKT